MTELIVFDLDGTLLDTLEDIGRSTDMALEELGCPTHTLEEYRYFIGNGIRKLVERALPEDRRDPETVGETLRLFLKYYDSHIHDCTRPFPGIREMLGTLRERGIAAAVASNKYQAGAEKLIRHFWGEGYFKAVEGQREDRPVKPDPAIVQDILDAAGIRDKSRVLYVGDSGVDMQTAARARLTSVGVTWGVRTRTELEENGAVHIIDSPAGLLDLVEA